MRWRQKKKNLKKSIEWRKKNCPLFDFYIATTSGPAELRKFSGGLSFKPPVGPNSDIGGNI